MGIFDNLFKSHKRNNAKDNGKEEVVSESSPADYDEEYIVPIPPSIPFDEIKINNEVQMRQRELELIRKFCGDKDFIRNHNSDITIL